MAPERWLILADDLTGAADTAIAFARAGWAASVAWGMAVPDDAVLALDAGSRQLSARDAAARHRALLHAHRGSHTARFKKIDSTLRGQPAAELAASLHVLRDQGHHAFALVAPAFPSQGRTTVDGRIRLHGHALEASALWAHEHSYPDADLRAVLEGEGLRVHQAPLAGVRDAPWLHRALHEAAADGADALICDAVTEADLAAIVHAARPMASRLLWVGSAGLARALAGAFPGRGVPAAVPRLEGPILTVVGSFADVSRAGARLLAADPAILHLAIEPAVLRAGPDDAAWQAVATRAADAIGSGRDVLAVIAAAPDIRAAEAPLLAGRLAALLRPAASGAGALVATGGETALALLDTCGITGLRMLEEVEPGVPVGLARGARAIPVITKAGAFGDAATLPRCLAHLRRP
ncbi:MAG TPA: four-carbon acid sugar kinase family protein [Roseomonas sp.]|jgi:uncharacterized protein YgbK (DUF1537 family)